MTEFIFSAIIIIVVVIIIIITNPLYDTLEPLRFYLFFFFQITSQQGDNVTNVMMYEQKTVKRICQSLKMFIVSFILLNNNK